MLQSAILFLGLFRFFQFSGENGSVIHSLITEGDRVLFSREIATGSLYIMLLAISIFLVTILLLARYAYKRDRYGHIADSKILSLNVGPGACQ